MDDLVIDAFEFARRGDQTSGKIAVSGLTRLSRELVDTTGDIAWTLTGGRHPLGHDQLLLDVAGTVQLLCQRCLSPLSQQIKSDSVLILTADEESADEVDAVLDDDTVEVIVGSNRFDIKALIEDEVLLALPISPRHELCPNRAVDVVVQSDSKESPFSVLKNLK